MSKKEQYRNVRKSKYTQISNELLSDSDLTLQAKGLMSIFLSNSNDWEIKMKEIIGRSKNGRDAHYSAVKELISSRYFSRISVFHKYNKFSNIIYIFSDIKQEVENEVLSIKNQYMNKKQR